MNSIAAIVATGFPTVRKPSKQMPSRHAGQVASAVGVCLVVCACPDRRAALDASASAAGWRTITRADAGNAHAAAEQSGVQLAIVDLEPEGTPAGFRWLCEWLMENCSGGLLLLICGHAENAAEELWARQLGAWAYLPGVADASQCESWLHDSRAAARRLAWQPDDLFPSVGLMEIMSPHGGCRDGEWTPQRETTGLERFCKPQEDWHDDQKND